MIYNKNQEKSTDYPELITTEVSLVANALKADNFGQENFDDGSWNDVIDETFELLKVIPISERHHLMDELVGFWRHVHEHIPLNGKKISDPDVMNDVPLKKVPSGHDGTPSKLFSGKSFPTYQDSTWDHYNPQTIRGHTDNQYNDA